MTPTPSAGGGNSAAGVRALLGAFGTAGLLVAATWLHPSLEAYRPWSPGDPLPVVGALTPRGEKRVVEDAVSGMSIVEAPPAAPDALVGAAAPAGAPSAADGAPPASPAGPLPSAAGMPARPPGVATALEDVDHRGMDRFYRALHRAAAGSGIARAAHFGDSTIAADGITSQVRSRLQGRFGDGGPGYLSAGMDPRWNMRRDVTIARAGTWDTVSLLLGGGDGRYGFGGIVSTAAADATLSVTSPRGRDGKPQRMHRLELWFQGGAARGSWWAQVDGAPVGAGAATAESTTDRWLALDDADGYSRVAIGASGGPVPFYGVVMETAGPGVVWDALGVVGVGSRSFTQQSKAHLSRQVAQRAPDLVVVMLGGNELGLPALGRGEGGGYVPVFTDTLRRLRAGAPDAGCLVITPIDQGTREGGTATTKPNLPRLVAAQRKAAAAEGCAFWNAWAAMGGEGAIARWSTLRPPLAWTDLNHLSKAGQDIVGNLLADAIEHGYDGWLASGGPGRPAAAPTVTPPTPEPLAGGALPAPTDAAGAAPPPGDAPPGGAPGTVPPPGDAPPGGAADTTGPAAPPAPEGGLLPPSHAAPPAGGPEAPHTPPPPGAP